MIVSSSKLTTLDSSASLSTKTPQATWDHSLKLMCKWCHRRWTVKCSLPTWTPWFPSPALSLRNSKLIQLHHRRMSFQITVRSLKLCTESCLRLSLKMIYKMCSRMKAPMGRDCHFLRSEYKTETMLQPLESRFIIIGSRGDLHLSLR